MTTTPENSPDDERPGLADGTGGEVPSDQGEGHDPQRGDGPLGDEGGAADREGISDDESQEASGAQE